MNILKQIKYHLWAEKEFSKVLENINQDQWITADQVLGKSLQDIYIHKIEVMWYWFTHVQQNKPTDPPKFEDMTAKELLSYLFQQFDEIESFVQNNPNILLTISLPWLNQPYIITAYELLFNNLNHHTYHRGQIAMLLKRKNIQVPETDYNPYMFVSLDLE
ncbi:DinB family protein [Candidatus Hodarchaeum mangrovi]